MVTSPPERVRIINGPVPKWSAEEGVWRMNLVWLRWLRAMLVTLNGTTQRVGSVVSIPAANGNISPTEVPTQGLTRGMYRFNAYARITRPGAASSSISVGVCWVDGGTLCTATSPALATNAVDTVASLSQLIVADQGSAIRYFVNYDSAGDPDMTYRLSVSVEDVAAGAEV